VQGCATGCVEMTNFQTLNLSSRAPLPKLPQSGLYPRLPEGSGRWSPPFRLYVYSWLPASKTFDSGIFFHQQHWGSSTNCDLVDHAPQPELAWRTYRPHSQCFQPSLEGTCLTKASQTGLAIRASVQAVRTGNTSPAVAAGSVPSAAQQPEAVVLHLQPLALKISLLCSRSRTAW
jgi:hypothetical protein